MLKLWLLFLSAVVLYKYFAVIRKFGFTIINSASTSAQQPISDDWLTKYSHLLNNESTDSILATKEATN
jgi:hypothetical protein